MTHTTRTGRPTCLPLTSDQLDAMTELCEQLLAYFPTWQAKRAAQSAAAVPQRASAHAKRTRRAAATSRPQNRIRREQAITR
jgi:hypothetical protein